MASTTNGKGETRKHWATPELRKTSIEQITANSNNKPTLDGGAGKQTSRDS